MYIHMYIYTRMYIYKLYINVNVYMCTYVCKYNVVHPAEFRHSCLGRRDIGWRMGMVVAHVAVALPVEIAYRVTCNCHEHHVVLFQSSI